MTQLKAYAGKRIERRVLDVDHAETMDDHHLLCCWDTCDSYGLEMWKARVEDGTKRFPRNTFFVFCSERHLQYWVNSTRDLYNLPPGFKLGII